MRVFIFVEYLYKFIQIHINVIYNSFNMNLKKINNISITASDINVGDRIPVGGTMPGALNLSLEIDKIPDELSNAFEK